MPLSLQDLKKDIEEATESTWSYVGDTLVDLCSYAEYENKVRSLVSQLPVDVEVVDAPNLLKYIIIRVRS
jgi:hypothetical protein